MKVTKKVAKRFKNWTSEEKRIMKKWYSKEGGKIIKRLPNKTMDQIRHYAAFNGLHVTGGYGKGSQSKNKKVWTATDLTILVSSLNAGDSYRTIAKKIGGISSTTVGNKARELGFSRKDPIVRFSNIETEIITTFYPVESMKSVLSRLEKAGFERTAGTVYGYAIKLGLVNTVTLRPGQVTQVELDTVSTLTNAGKTVTYTATVVGKSDSTVYAYRKMLEEEKKTEEKKGSTWTSSEKQELMAKCNTYTVNQLAKLLNRTPKAVENKIYRMGLK